MICSMLFLFRLIGLSPAARLAPSPGCRFVVIQGGLCYLL
jgi:hypothetical protein